MRTSIALRLPACPPPACPLPEGRARTPGRGHGRLESRLLLARWELLALLTVTQDLQGLGHWACTGRLQSCLMSPAAPGQPLPVVGTQEWLVLRKRWAMWCPPPLSSSPSLPPPSSYCNNSCRCKQLCEL